MGTHFWGTRFQISFLNHFPNLKLVNDGGTVGMKEGKQHLLYVLTKY